MLPLWHWQMVDVVDLTHVGYLLPAHAPQLVAPHAVAASEHLIAVNSWVRSGFGEHAVYLYDAVSKVRT